MRIRVSLSLVIAVLVAAMLSCESGAPRGGKSDALKSIDETSLPPITGRIELTIHELARLQVPQHPDLRCCFFGEPEGPEPKVIAWYWRSNNRLMAAYEIRLSLDEPSPADDGIAFGDVQKNPDTNVATCLTKVTLRDARKDLLLFEGTEKFEIGEGGKREEARFRPLLALEGSVTKFGATTMDGAAVSALAGKGAIPKVNYVATDRSGRSVLTETLPVKDAPGDILAGSVATQTDTAAPWTVTNTSRNSVRFVYRVPAPLRAVDGPGEGNFVLAPGETRTVCSITSGASGTYPIEYAQAALVPAAPDLLAAEAPEELIWQGGPAQGPVVFDTGAGAAGELVEGSRRLPLELSGYTASPLKNAELNNAPASVATGDNSSVGGFGEMAPFAIGGLGALLAVGPNLLKGKTETGEKVETLFTAVPAELPVAALANTKRADGVVAIAVDNADLWKALGMAPLRPNIYPTPGVHEATARRKDTEPPRYPEGREYSRETPRILHASPMPLEEKVLVRFPAAIATLIALWAVPTIDLQALAASYGHWLPQLGLSIGLTAAGREALDNYTKLGENAANALEKAPETSETFGAIGVALNDPGGFAREFFGSIWRGIAGFLKSLWDAPASSDCGPPLGYDEFMRPINYD